MQIIHTIAQQQELFCSWVSTPLRNIAEHCGEIWSCEGREEAQLTQALQESMKQIPQFALCYLLSPEGTIISPTISHDGCDQSDIGRDISQRPYFLERIEGQDFFLSRPYTSIKTQHPCMTALQSVYVNGQLFAFIAIDFDGSAEESPAKGFHLRSYTQIKGDPSIRQNLFAQTRTITPMEEQIDPAHDHAEWLLKHHGAFFVQLRYSRSTATVRFTDRPYHDTMFTLDELLESNSINRQPITSMATISPEQIRPVLDLFKELRYADDNIYLRSGSLNVISGMVELNFSCDGTHCLPATEFLEKSVDFWLNPGTNVCVDSSKPAETEQEPVPAFSNGTHYSNLQPGWNTA